MRVLKHARVLHLAALNLHLYTTVYTCKRSNSLLLTMCVLPGPTGRPALIVAFDTEQLPDGTKIAQEVQLQMCEMIAHYCADSVKQRCLPGSVTVWKDDALVLALGSHNELLRQWAKSFGTFLGRYRLLGAQPEYESATCKVSL